jgi:plastocyanin
VILLTLAATGMTMPVVAQRAGAGVAVAGKISVLDKGNKQASDIGAAIIWLEGPSAPVAAPKAVQVLTEEKEFRPRVSVLPVGSTVTFPNNDPFNHNVFSLAPEAPFDLGLYARGQQANSAKFLKTGLIKVYCNIHPQMGAFILVRDNPYYTQPGTDGSFQITGVKPGTYTLHAWHERAAEVTKPVTVGPAGVTDAALELDARGYAFKPHLNKLGQPYPRGGVRY